MQIVGVLMRWFIWYFELYAFILQWLPLENVKKGMVHLKLVWLYLSKNPTNLGKVSRSSSFFCEGDAKIKYVIYICKN